MPRDQNPLELKCYKSTFGFGFNVRSKLSVACKMPLVIVNTWLRPPFTEHYTRSILLNESLKQTTQVTNKCARTFETEPSRILFRCVNIFRNPIRILRRWIFFKYVIGECKTKFPRIEFLGVFFRARFVS